VLSTPPAFVLSQDQTLQTKNKKQCQEKTQPTKTNKPTKNKPSVSQPTKTINQQTSVQKASQATPTKKQKQNKKGQNKKTHYRVHKQHPHNHFHRILSALSEIKIVAISAKGVEKGSVRNTCFVAEPDIYFT
jgi:hypothetical protein